jgi:hypothetical protein
VLSFWGVKEPHLSNGIHPGWQAFHATQSQYDRQEISENHDCHEMVRATHASSMNQRINFLKTCYYFGAAADLLAAIPMLFPEVARAMFGLERTAFTDDYLYVSRIGASLMLGWTFLLLWGSFKPVERRAVLLLTVFPVLIGLLIASILFAASGFVAVQYVTPLWIFYAIIIPLYVVAYFVANRNLLPGT